MRAWLFHTGIWTPDIIGLVYISFSGIVKMLIKEYLFPAVIYAVIGYVMQKINKKI